MICIYFYIFYYIIILYIIMSYNVNDYVNEVHHKITKPSTTRRVYSNYVGEIFSIDLVDMQEFNSINKGYKYILNGIDCYSRYAFSKPLKDKSAKTVSNALNEIMIENNYYPTKIWCDQGSEFYNKEVDKLRKKHNIQIYSTYGPQKAVMVERFNKTMKGMMYKIFTRNGNHVWYNILDEIINKYNNKIHSTLKNKPIDIFKKKIEITNELDIANEDQIKKAKFKVGDRVRIPLSRTVFDKKGYLKNWSDEIFIVCEIIKSNPITYKIKDDKNKIINGSFYDAELLKTKMKENVYMIEKLLKKRKYKGKIQYLVKWLGYNETSWQNESDIEDLENMDKL